MGKKRNDLAYFAGFFDGEGCICIASQRSQYKEKIFRHYRLEVVIGSTNHWIIELMKMQFGGYVYLDKRDNRPTLTHRPFWRWMICSKQAMSFLQEILPYLHLKKAEAEIAITWQSQRRKGKSSQEDKGKATVLAEAQRIILSKLKRQEVT